MRQTSSTARAPAPAGRVVPFTPARASAMDWGLPVLVVLLVELIVAGIPQYFRYDDAGWLHLARDHAREPWALLSPALDVSAYSGLGSYYRPAVAILWWAVYRIAGPEPVAYQVVSGVLFAISVVYLLFAARLLAGRLAAWGATAAFLSFLPLVGYGVYRMGSLHVGQAALLAAAYHLLRGAAGRRGHVLAGLVLALVAALARQSAAVILLAAALAYVLAGPRRAGGSRVARAAALLAIAGPAAAIVLALSPSTREALTAAGTAGSGGGALERLAFYAGAAVRPPHGLVLVAAALAALAAAVAPRLADRRESERGRAAVLWAARLLPVAALAVVRWPGAAIGALAAGAAAACLTGGRAALVAVVWAVAALVPYLGHRVYYARYLEEAAYGLALLAGVSAAVSVRRLGGRTRAARPARRSAPRARPAVAGVLVAVLAAVAVPLGVPRLPLARGYAAVLSRSRLHADNLRGLFDAVVRLAPQGATLFEPAVIGAAVREPSSRFAADAEDRESGLAPMEPRDATELLLALGRADLTVRPLDATRPGTEESAGEWVLCLNGAQADRAARLGRATPVFAAGAGSERTALYRVTEETSGR